MSKEGLSAIYSSLHSPRPAGLCTVKKCRQLLGSNCWFSTLKGRLNASPSELAGLADDPELAGEGFLWEKAHPLANELVLEPPVALRHVTLHSPDLKESRSGRASTGTKWSTDPTQVSRYFVLECVV